MKKQRIEQAVIIIKNAIVNSISVKESSVKHGLASTYVKNVKADVFKAKENGKITDELYDLFNNTYDEYCEVYLNLKKNPTSRQQSQELPTKQEEPNKPKDIPKVGSRETFNQKNDNEADYEWVGGSNYPIDHVHTLEDLIAATKVDTNIWKTAAHTVNKWDVTMRMKNKDTGEFEAKTFQNWQVKARLERDVKSVREKMIGEIFQEMTKDYVVPTSQVDTLALSPDPDEKNLLEISIFDLHIGKLAWGGETFENYDVKIARERFLTSIKKLLKGASGFKFERILFPIGNDFFNSDTILNTTTKGTPQDEDLRWQKTFDVGTRLLVDAINMLKQTGVPVDVLVIPGNHDFERSYYLGSFLGAWFKGDSSVTIDNHASPRKYYRYGNTLLGLTHGSEEKEASLPLLMATDIASKPMWSETKFHEWHLGHIHRKRTVQYDINKSRLLNEDLGVTVRYLSSLSGTEEWHHKRGYVGSTKAADGFVWNHEFGLVAHLNTNLILE